MRDNVRKNLTEAVEDYLKSIYELTRAGTLATTNQIAARMGVRPASVTGMLKRLAAYQPPLLKYHRHHGVSLTLDGERVALEVIRHHRLLELYLHQSLGYPWDEVHTEADRLEHVISEDFEERIARLLGNPNHDPHGDPIPSRDLRLPEESAVPLNELRPGQRGTIHRVGSEDPGLLRYLESVGLTPDARLTVVGRSAFDDNLRLRVSEQEVVLGPKVAARILVEVAHTQEGAFMG